MLRLACVLLYQGRFKSRRSRGSGISLRVRSILVTFCIYFCSSYIIFILVLCAMLCSFSTSNSLVFAFSQFACVCMFVCVLCIEHMFCAGVVGDCWCLCCWWCCCWWPWCWWWSWWCVLVVVVVVVVLVLVLVLLVLLARVGAAGGGGGSVGRMNFGTSFAPRSPTSFAPRHNCNKVRVLFYVLVSVPRFHCKALLSMKALFFLCPTMQIGLVQWIWKFEDFWVDSGMCAQSGGSHIIRMKSGTGHCFFLLRTMQIGLI